MVPLPLVLETSVLKTVYFFLQFRIEIIYCCRNPESEFRQNSETESELVCVHEPEHGTEFRFQP